MARKAKAQTVVEEPTTENGAAQATAEMRVDTEVKAEGTTARLFPERFQQQEAPATQETTKVEEADDNTEPAKVPEEVKETAPSEIDLDEFLAKSGLDLSKVKIKTKVDGKEELLPIDEVRKSYQIRKHLESEAQKLGLKRKEWAAEQMKNFETATKPNGTPSGTEKATQKPELNNEDDLLNEIVERLAQRIDPKIKAIEDVTAPIMYERNRDAVDKSLKAMGYEDFREYIPKIETFIASLDNPSAVQFYDTPEGVKGLYFQMKLEESRSQQSAAKDPGMAKPKPPVVRIPSGSGPSSASVGDDDVARFNSLRAKAQKTKSISDITAVVAQMRKMKGWE
ncbi:MAG: hypothetical protein E6Q97_26510 [Desulfurellales bacterium]|nr:MAG: hypothetical protein E6Q97_26510 [Desulfurellales bacterium]